MNGEMILNDLGMKLNELIVEIPSHHPYAQIPVYLVMPNHVHLIVCIDGTDTDCTDLACRDVACRVSTTTNNHHHQQQRQRQPIIYRIKKCRKLQINVGCYPLQWVE